MCGATDQQKDIANSQQQMYDTLNKNYATAFGQFQELQSALQSTFMPILQAGPSQPGMSSAEETALRTQNAEGIAQNYGAAQKSTAQMLAAQGGGNTLLPSSISANILAGNTNAAAAQRASGDLAITNQNYQQGYQNWASAAQMLAGTANAWNPNQFGNTSTGAGSAAGETANQIAQANNSIWNSVIGAAGAIGGAALGNPSGILSSFTRSPATQMLAGQNPAIASYNALQSMPAPSMPTGLGMAGSVPKFG